VQQLIAYLRTELPKVTAANANNTPVASHAADPQQAPSSPIAAVTVQ
jgi:hypothetical protein